MPYIHMNQPWVYMCSPSWTPLPPSSPSHSSGSSQCTSPEHSLSCTEPGLVIYFTYDNIHVSILFPQSSHPRLLPQSAKVCSLHLCLFRCLAYRIIIAIFLNSIYMHVNLLYWCYSFWLTSLCIIGSGFIHLIRTDSNAFFLIAE